MTAIIETSFGKGSAIAKTRPPEVEAETETVRRRLARWLAERDCDFEELRSALALSASRLESELRHVQRSARGAGGRLHVEPPRCRACGFAFPGRESRHLHPPGRCPRCRSQRIDPPVFRLRSQFGLRS
ncbi:MAG: transcriptional regulator [Myxococcota bacterium]